MALTFSQIITFDASADAFKTDFESAMKNIEQTAYGQYLLQKLIDLYPDGVVIRNILGADSSGE